METSNGSIEKKLATNGRSEITTNPKDLFLT